MARLVSRNDERMVDRNRSVVTAYQVAHASLYQSGTPTLVEDHKALVESLIADLQGDGFASLGDFQTKNRLLNIQRLNFDSEEDFRVGATSEQKLSAMGMI